MAQNPKVSIILPTYNGSRFIRQAVESVLRQSFQDWELLVIDDGSKDDTESIIREFVSQNKRIKYLKNRENLGIQKSLNRGLKEASGKYIARIDDDDTWIDPEKLKKQVGFLDSHPDYLLVGTGTVVVNEKGKELYRFFNLETDKEIRNRLLAKNCFTHSSVLFSKSATLKFGGYSEDLSVRHIEDYDLWLKLGTTGKLANLQIYGTRFMLRKGAISSKNKIDQFRKAITLSKKYRQDYPRYWQALFWGCLRLIFYGLFSFLPLAFVKNKIAKWYKEG